MPVGDARVRTDDASRREVAEALGRHMADGRLTLGEYEERLEQTFAAITEADLAQVMRDLPALQTATQRRRREQAARSMVAGWLGLCLLFITIWVLTGADYYFWPIWPILGTGMGTLSNAYAIWRSRENHEEPGRDAARVSRGPCAVRACAGRSKST